MLSLFPTFQSWEAGYITPHQAPAYNEVGGLFHVGSVGIIMSGWLGAINYGVIVANDADSYVRG